MSGVIDKTLTTGSVTAQKVASVPECEYASVNVVIVNPTNNDVTVSLYFGMDAAGVTPSDLVDAEAVIPAKGRYVYACEVANSEEHVFVLTSTSGLPVRVTAILAE